MLIISLTFGQRSNGLCPNGVDSTVQLFSLVLISCILSLNFHFHQWNNNNKNNNNKTPANRVCRVQSLYVLFYMENCLKPLVMVSFGKCDDFHARSVLKVLAPVEICCQLVLLKINTNFFRYQNYRYIS